ncbi:hypothetical protein MBLNU457_4639t1 [Dothideomycetes sp. NU457]
MSSHIQHCINHVPPYTKDKKHQTEHEDMGDQPEDKATAFDAIAKATVDTTPNSNIEQSDLNNPSATRDPKPSQPSIQAREPTSEPNQPAAPKQSSPLYFYPNPDTFTFEEPVRYLSPPGSPTPSPSTVARTESRTTTVCCICSKCGHVNEKDTTNEGVSSYPRPFSLRGRYH